MNQVTFMSCIYLILASWQNFIQYSAASAAMTTGQTQSSFILASRKAHSLGFFMFLFKSVWQREKA